jgi:hypothetical protein
MTVTTQPPVVPPGKLADIVGSLRLTPAGDPLDPLVFVDMSAHCSDADISAAVDACAHANQVIIGIAESPADDRLVPLLSALTATIARSSTSRHAVEVTDLDATRDMIATQVQLAPRAAVTLAGLLGVTSTLAVREALTAESLAYSMLLGGTEFSRWRAGRPEPSRAHAEDGPPLLLHRDGATLQVVLNRPARRNALDRDLRDALIEALDLLRLDSTITRMQWRGNGPTFCSGGDLQEFGTFGDAVLAHLVRIDRSIAARVHACRDRVEVFLHGACIGAGIEMPSFAGRVTATPDAYFQLPELRMGLVPGAGGTVGITRRVGRWRAAYLMLSGQPIDSGTALAWGLVDAVGD